MKRLLVLGFLVLATSSLMADPSLSHEANPVKSPDMKSSKNSASLDLPVDVSSFSRDSHSSAVADALSTCSPTQGSPVLSFKR
jgi:hypothetical protein